MSNTDRYYVMAKHSMMVFPSFIKVKIQIQQIYSDQSRVNKNTILSTKPSTTEPTTPMSAPTSQMWSSRSVLEASWECECSRTLEMKPESVNQRSSRTLNPLPAVPAARWLCQGSREHKSLTAGVKWNQAKCLISSDSLNMLLHVCAAAEMTQITPCGLWSII